MNDSSALANPACSAQANFPLSAVMGAWLEQLASTHSPGNARAATSVALLRNAPTGTAESRPGNVPVVSVSCRFGRITSPMSYCA